MPKKIGGQDHDLHEQLPFIIPKFRVPQLIWSIITFVIIFLLAWVFFAHAKEYPVQPQTYGSLPVVEIPMNWQGYATLKRIASCESWGNPTLEPRQFDENGAVLHGVVNPQDIGLAQINLPSWGNKALELGYDIFTPEGNLGMAKWIYDTYGSAPWYLSKGCWG